MRPVAFLTVLFIGCSLTSARPPPPCSLRSTVTDAKLTLGTPDGRTSFREGEIIPLVLSFRSTADKRYLARDRNYDRRIPLNFDTYCLEPEARDPLADYPASSAIAGNFGSTQQLTEKALAATAELNEWRQPGPGHYRLWIVTTRVTAEPTGPVSLNSFRAGDGVVPVTLRSNTIAFEVTKADAQTRTRQLQEVTATYQNATGDLQKEAAHRLRFLNTKDSTDTLARLFWSLNDQPGGWDLMFGLFGSSDRAEAIAAMQREIGGPDHPITHDFLTTLTQLQVAGEHPGDPGQHLADLPNWERRSQKMMVHEREAKEAGLAATVAALPRKTGQARALTLETLATDRSGYFNKETASLLRRQLIADWGELPEKTRWDLLRDRWPLLAGPEMVPLLTETLSHPVPQFGSQERNAALKHVFELDPVEGRSLILRDLNDPKAQPSISLAKLLTSEDLRSAVHQAARRVEAHDARDVDWHLVELFGDESELGSLEAMYGANIDQLSREGCIEVPIPILRYFLRVDPKFGARTVEAWLTARQIPHCYPDLLAELGASLPTVEQVAIRALDDGNLEVSTGAARALGRWGTTKAETPLWARLTRFHQEWPTGVDQLPLTDSDTRARVLALDNLQRTLMYAIVGGTNWICGPEKLTRLRELVSGQSRSDLSHWIDEWEGEDGRLIIVPNYTGPEDRLNFSIMQLPYSNLDEEQIRVKLAQFPSGSKLYFQTYTAEQMGSPVSMEKQQAVLQGLRKYAAQYGISIDERPR